MTLSPWDAYDGMCVAFNERRYWAAYQLASALTAWLDTPESLYKFSDKRRVMVFQMLKDSISRLLEEADPGGERQ